MTWLDRHIYTIGNIVQRSFGPQPDGVRSGFARFVQGTMMEPQDGGPETSFRFQIDLMPYIEQAFVPFSRCIRPNPALVGMLGLDLSRMPMLEQYLDGYFSQIGFTCIDFPSGSLRLGSNFEVKAMFVRSASLIKKGNVVGPAFTKQHIFFDAILGRPGLPTRQRISWRRPGNSAIQADVPIDDDYPGEETKPASMIAQAGLTIEEVIGDLSQIALAAIIHANLHLGTTSAVQKRRLPVGDPALFLDAPAPGESAVNTVEISDDTADGELSDAVAA